MHIRLRDCATRTYFLVDTAARTVYADLDERGAASRADEPDAALAERALASASDYAEYFARAVPGTKTPDGKFLVRGPLTQAERATRRAGGDVSTERPALQLHLDFFDLDLDGRITLAENYRGWRGLGFSRFGAARKALFSALFFGWPAIEIERIGARRHAGTGIFDRQGAVDAARLAPYLAQFDAAGGELSCAQLFDLLERHAPKGMVSRAQFGSLFAVCKRQNGNRDVITKAQFNGLFDGSLLWLTASTPNRAGRRGRRARWLQPASGAA
jgi:hypothetical protein